MNILFSACNGCDNTIEKESFFHFNKKESRISLISNKYEKPKEEIISNGSTNNNLEIIEYPYDIDFNDENNNQLNSNYNDIAFFQNNYDFNVNNNIKNLYDERIYNCEILDNNFNLKNFGNISSSDIINNEDSILQNKALLLNYYNNNQNLKNNNNKYNNKNNNNKSDNKKNNMIKKIKIKNDKNSNITKKDDKIGLKVEISYPDSDTFISKNNNKSKSHGEKEFNVKKYKINLKKCQNLEKSKTNYSIFNNFKKNNMVKNKVTSKNKDINLKSRKSIKYKIYNTSKIYKVPITSNNIFKLKSMSKLNDMRKIKNNKIKQKKNYILPINKIVKAKFSKSYIDTNNTHIIKSNKISYRNTISCYINEKKNKINFSHVWMNNKDIHSQNISKTFINPFDKIETKIKKNKIVNSIRLRNKLK